MVSPSLASQLLKDIADRLESGTQRWEDESGEPKETAISREIMPADGSNPALAQ
jgi:hypothetical protein